MRKSYGFIHINFYFRHLRKIGVDILLGFNRGNIDLLGQPVLRYSVNNAEINRFGMAANKRRNLFPIKPENSHRRGSMNIRVFGKSLF